jgi:hypothetical protein
MKMIRKILSLIIVLLGIVHIVFAFPIGTFDTDDIWFIGAGMALVFSGFLNLAATQHCNTSLIGILAVSGNVASLILFLLARQVLQEPQVYVGMYLYLAMILLYGIPFLRNSKTSGQYTHFQNTQTGLPEVLAETQVIPILRIFDKKKTEEFYIDWLGFTIDWEHRFEETLPLYMQVSKADIVLHLSEHHGDATPGGKVFIACKGLKEYHRMLLDKNYSFNRPGLDTASWGSLCMEVIDPFGNKLLFSEKK